MTQLPADPNEAPPATPHPNSATVTLEDVRHVAALANLDLTAEEEPRMQRDLNAILGHIAVLSGLDTVGIEPMAQVGDLLREAPAVHGETLRADAPRPSLDRAAVMAEAPETDGRFFKVPKVIER
jgi:aspartyl-tRNA(Asn)/glutamyl-tRNA(Gln) amidotransferase subunit C